MKITQNPKVLTLPRNIKNNHRKTEVKILHSFTINLIAITVIKWRMRYRAFSLIFNIKRVSLIPQ
jgi:hypothetical protein